MDLDSLNTPAGKLVGVFLAACPNLRLPKRSFAAYSLERKMRDAVSAAQGYSGLIAKYRMVENLSYFMHADFDWSQEHLIVLLLKDDVAALVLWRAVARCWHPSEALERFGVAMVERANDRRLDRETRRELVFNLVIESLRAFHASRPPAVPNQRIQQMIRTLDDEVRASAANAVPRFVRDLSASPATSPAKDGEGRNGPETAANLFRSSAALFLREVWPQERSLVTPGVSSALADLPATSGAAFAEAVDTIARFLVPFECWSMVDYGFHGEDERSEKFALIDDSAKAQALLQLLDLTIGTSGRSVVPLDLTDALDQIVKIDPSLATSASLRRLATAARR